MSGDDFERAPEILVVEDRLARGLNGQTKPEARAAGACVMCGSRSMGASDFRDALSQREARISQLCQGCQDRVFAEPEEDEDGSG